MTRAEYEHSQAVDMLTLVLCLPFCMWLGWWGILLAFAIGTGINIAADRAGKKPQCAHEFDYMRDMTGRDENGMVSCRCCKCGQVFRAECGLDLPGRLIQKQQDSAQVAGKDGA